MQHPWPSCLTTVVNEMTMDDEATCVETARRATMGSSLSVRKRRRWHGKSDKECTSIRIRPQNCKTYVESLLMAPRQMSKPHLPRSPAPTKPGGGKTVSCCCFYVLPFFHLSSTSHIFHKNKSTQTFISTSDGNKLHRRGWTNRTSKTNFVFFYGWIWRSDHGVSVSSIRGRRKGDQLKAWP